MSSQRKQGADSDLYNLSWDSDRPTWYQPPSTGSGIDDSHGVQGCEDFVPSLTTDDPLGTGEISDNLLSHQLDIISCSGDGENFPDDEVLKKLGRSTPDAAALAQLIEANLDVARQWHSSLELAISTVAEMGGEGVFVDRDAVEAEISEQLGILEAAYWAKRELLQRLPESLRRDTTDAFVTSLKVKYLNERAITEMERVVAGLHSLNKFPALFPGETLSRRVPPQIGVKKDPKLEDFHQAFEFFLAKSPKRPNNILYVRALQTASSLLRIPPVNPYHLNDAMCWFPEKSSGHPFTAKCIYRKEDIPTERVRSFIHSIKYGRMNKIWVPCTAMHRTTISGKADKFQLTWVYPCALTMAEGMFTMPLIEAYKRVKGHYALGFRLARGEMKYLASTREGQQWLSLDWSKFDVNVPAWLIRDAFAILQEQIDFSRYYDHGVPPDNMSLPRLWNVLINYFINTPLRFPDGVVRRKKSGIPNGSYFTNLIETVANIIMCSYILESLDSNIQRRCSWFMGDEALLLLQDPISIVDFASVAMHVFGAEVNTTKSHIGSTFSFLGYGSTES